MCLTGRLRRPLRHVLENAWPQRRTRSIESTIGLLIFLELVDRRGRPSMAGLHYPIDTRPADAERLGDGRGSEALCPHLTHRSSVYRGTPSLVDADCLRLR